jgi:hypothetical protein
MKARLAAPIGMRFKFYLKSGETKLLGNFSLGTSWDEAKAQIISIDEYKELENISSNISYGTLYDTPSGELEPGCLYWNHYYPKDYYWDNQEGPHLMAILPNGDHWCIDSRANNCTLPNDRTHRCWVRTGEIPNITVGKSGPTCSAGAGSILSGNYHGFLTNGEFT